MEARAEDTPEIGDPSVRRLRLHDRVVPGDVEKLLTLAEDYSERYEQASSRLAIWDASVASFVVMLAGVVIWRVASEPPPVDWSAWWFLPLLFYIGMLCCWLWRGRARYHDLRTRERAAVEQIVEMLREIEPQVARASGWSALERAEFRIRLSRFGIAGGKR